jgi:hypothetical protein
VLDEMVEHVEKLLITGTALPDLIALRWRYGFYQRITYDFEVFSAAQERWLEVSSVSNFESYQTNRLKCRYKDADGKMQFTHSLNGSSLALPRIFACLLENNQRENGIVYRKCYIPISIPLRSIEITAIPENKKGFEPLLKTADQTLYKIRNRQTQKSIITKRNHSTSHVHRFLVGYSLFLALDLDRRSHRQ